MRIFSVVILRVLCVNFASLRFLLLSTPHKTSAKPNPATVSLSKILLTPAPGEDKNKKAPQNFFRGA